MITMKMKKNKLTLQQKRTAQYLLMGMSIKKVSKEIDTPTGTIRHWLYYNRKFNKYLTKIDREFDDMINRQQKSHLKKVFKSLLKIVNGEKTKRLVKGKKVKVERIPVEAKLKAIELYLRINRRFPQDSSKIQMDHNVVGTVVNRHEGEIELIPEKLPFEEKEKLKRMLVDARQMQLISNNN